MSAAEAARGAQPLWSLVPVERPRAVHPARVGGDARRARRPGRPSGRGDGLVERADGDSRSCCPPPAGCASWPTTGRARSPTSACGRWPAAARGSCSAPVGVIGLRGPSASPWAEPALETAASLLAGNGVLLGVPAQRLRNVFLRAGVPGELVELSEDFDGAHVHRSAAAGPTRDAARAPRRAARQGRRRGAAERVHRRPDRDRRPATQPRSSTRSPPERCSSGR